MYLVLYVLNGEACYAKADDIFEASEAREALIARGAQEVFITKNPDYENEDD